MQLQACGQYCTCLKWEVGQSAHPRSNRRENNLFETGVHLAAEHEVGRAALRAQPHARSSRVHACCGVGHQPVHRKRGAHVRARPPHVAPQARRVPRGGPASAPIGRCGHKSGRVPRMRTTVDRGRCLDNAESLNTRSNMFTFPHRRGCGRGWPKFGELWPNEARIWAIGRFRDTC